jgi:hypothetical protein
MPALPHTTVVSGRAATPALPHTAAASGRTAATAAAAVPIAVARPIANLVSGPLRPATVLSAHSAAVVLYVEPLPGRSAGDTPEVTRIVTLLAREASGVPNGARTALGAADRPFAGIAAGDAAFVGAGGIRLVGSAFHAVRVVNTSVPRVAPSSDAVAAIADAAAASRRGVPDEPVAQLRAAIGGGDAARLRQAVRALIGLGSGSTPGGDDVLAGTLAGLNATRRDVRAQQITAAVLPDLDSRTPLMSADLLRLAAAGHVCTEAAAVLRATAGSCAELDRAVAVLLTVGHTSGADLATGIAIGLGAAALPEPRRARRAPGDLPRHPADHNDLPSGTR